MSINRSFSTTPSDDRSQIGLRSLQLLLLVLPLPLATNRYWSLALVFPLAIVTLLLALLQQKRNGQSISQRLRKVRPLLWPLYFFNLWVVLTLIPLPQAWVNTLSPAAMIVHQAISPDLPVYPLSTDFVATFVYFIVCQLLLYTTLATVLCCRRWHDIATVAYTLVASAVVQSALGVVLFGMHATVTFFEDTFIHDVAQGTFGNRNHFAAYLVSCLAIGIGLLLGQKPVETKTAVRWQDKVAKLLGILLSRKAPLRLLLIIIVIGIVLSRSRMGNTSFVISLLTVIGTYMLIASQRKTPVLIFLLSMVVVDVLIVGSWIGLDKVVDRVAGTDLTIEQKQHQAQAYERSESLEERWQTAKATIEIAKLFPIFGSGGGSFQLQYKIFGNPLPDGYYMPAAHCDYVEIASDTGLIGLALLSFPFLYAMRLAARTMKNMERRTKYRALAAGLLMACVAQALHALVEFQLQIPAVSATLCCILGLVFCIEHSESSKPRAYRRSAPTAPSA